MATISNPLNPALESASAQRYAFRVAAGIAAIDGLEADWPSIDFEAAAEFVGRQLLADRRTSGSRETDELFDSSSNVGARGPFGADSVAALRGQAMGGGSPWGGPMASFGWNLAAARAFSGEQTLMMASVRDSDGTLRAVAPLAKATGWFATRWEMLAVGRLNEPTDFIYTDRAALAALVEGILRAGRPLLLNRIPADSPTIEALRRAAAGRAVVAVRPQASCPFIPLDESWLVPESHFNSRRRSDYRRAIRRAERHGNLRAEVITPQPGDLDRLLQIAFDIEARSWKGAAGTALACDSLRGGHLRQFAHWAVQAGTLRIALLWIGREPVAMQIATEESDRWWLLKIGFDPAWADCSPGTLLLSETVRHAVRQQLTSYEFLGTAETWTQVWTPHERRCVSVRLYPHGLSGALAFGADALAVARRRLTRAIESRRNRSESAEPTSGDANAPPGKSESTVETAPN